MRDQAVQPALSPRLFRSIATVVALLGTLLLAGAIVTLALSRSPGAFILIFVEVLSVGGALLTINLLPRQPLRLAAIPLIATLVVGLSLYGLIFMPLTSLAAVSLVFTVLLTALTGSRAATAAVSACTAVVALLVVLVAPGLTVGLEIGILMPILLAVGPTIIIGLCWYITDSLLRARDEAIAIAEGRAAEAEQARAAAEQARAEAVARAEEQQRLLGLVQSLELPVLAIAPGILAVPLIGALDSRRLEAIGAAVLEAVDRERAHSVVFDLTGVADVDTAVAHGLIATAQAVRLLGATPLVSGVRPAVAHTLAGLGVPLEGLRAVNNLHEALAAAGER